jgi:hypothetical protein
MNNITANNDTTLDIELAWVLELDGRCFATLSPVELDRFMFFRAEGRDYGVTATVITEADPVELAEAGSQEQQDDIMRRANSTVSVVRS